jgi:hypothetical protein
LFRLKLPPPNWLSSFGLVTTTPGLPGVSAGSAALAMSTVSWMTGRAHALVALPLHASGPNGDE